MIEKVVKIVKLGDKNNDREYWLSRPMEERFAMVEELRRDFYGENYETEQGLQRVYRIIKRA